MDWVVVDGNETFLGLLKNCLFDGIIEGRVVMRGFELGGRGRGRERDVGG